MAGVQSVGEKPAQAPSGASTATGKAPAAALASGQALAAANGTGDKRDAAPLPEEPAKDVVDAAEDGEDEDDADAGPGEPHPLQFRWSLWHDQPLKTPRSAWGAELREIASFGTVEDFWALFNNLLEPSRLPLLHTYSLFKHGTRPEWEDPKLKHGGELRVQVSRDSVDQAWVDTVLALIGEAFDAPESDDIAGVVLQIRKGGYHRIAIWAKSLAGEQVLRNIGVRWRQVAIRSQDQIEYMSFSDLKGRVRKAKFAV